MEPVEGEGLSVRWPWSRKVKRVMLETEKVEVRTVTESLAQVLAAVERRPDALVRCVGLCLN